MPKEIREVELSAYAKTQYDAACLESRGYAFLYEALKCRLAHDPFTGAVQTHIQGGYVLFLCPPSVEPMEVRAFYLVSQRKVLIKKLLFF